MSETAPKATPEAAVLAPAQVSGEALTTTLHSLYRELLEGIPAGQPTWVTSGGPEGGAYGTIADLSAEQASRELHGTTLAAHVEHLRWALQLVNDYFAGVEPTADWSASWLVSQVDEGEWAEPRKALGRAGAEVLGNLASKQRWNDEMGIQGALASHGHTAYHVGALRQLRKQLASASR